KTHGCTPNFRIDGSCLSPPCDLVAITNVTWYPGELKITVKTGVNFDIYPVAFANFTFRDDYGHIVRFFKNPRFVNCVDCGESSNYTSYPYTSKWLFDANLTPQRGVWFDIWLSAHYFCGITNDRLECIPEDLHYRSQVPT
ncbi:24429_t:CDS:1, partial [Gigaspora rosea]